MATYRELLAQVRTEIDEISSVEAQERLESSDGSLFVDVREPDEWEEGHIPDAIYTGRGRLEQRVEGLVPDKARPLSSTAGRVALRVRREGARGARLRERRQPRRRVLGLEAERLRDHDSARPLARAALALQPAPADPRGRRGGPQRLLDARVLLVGAGGLGSPASLYLAAAGVGTLGIVDADVVDESNLQRQILHSTDRLGMPKVASAKRTLEALNPDVKVVKVPGAAASENVDRILADGCDVVVDGADNFPTRYLVNDASV